MLLGNRIFGYYEIFNVFIGEKSISRYYRNESKKRDDKNVEVPIFLRMKRSSTEKKSNRFTTKHA